jgi:glycosyltransferase involved in cell wall biosynthesis
MKTAAVVLNWQTLEVSKDSVRRLLKEPGVDQVILVDNGSTDGSKEYFADLELRLLNEQNHKFQLISLSENTGPSTGRNRALTRLKGGDYAYVFLCDGDILYVPGTVAEYRKVLDFYPDAGCVGQNSWKMVHELGHNGTLDIVDADVRMGTDYEVEDWFPMAWTQYGLFKAEPLLNHMFVAEPPFNEAGHGFEDDWYYHNLKEDGLVSLAVSLPLYYHAAHSSLRELDRLGLPSRTEERKKAFQKRWGKQSGWMDTLKKGITKSTRPKPQ